MLLILAVSCINVEANRCVFNVVSLGILDYRGAEMKVSFSMTYVYVPMLCLLY